MWGGFHTLLNAEFWTTGLYCSQDLYLVGWWTSLSPLTGPHPHRIWCCTATLRQGRLRSKQEINACTVVPTDQSVPLRMSLSFIEDLWAQVMKSALLCRRAASCLHHFKFFPTFYTTIIQRRLIKALKPLLAGFLRLKECRLDLCTVYR